MTMSGGKSKRGPGPEYYEMRGGANLYDPDWQKPTASQWLVLTVFIGIPFAVLAAVLAIIAFS